MSKYIFIKEPDSDNKHDRTVVRIESNTSSLPELLEDFESFLKASGFYFDGSVDIIGEEKES